MGLTLMAPSLECIPCGAIVRVCSRAFASRVEFLKLDMAMILQRKKPEVIVHVGFCATQIVIVQQVAWRSSVSMDGRGGVTLKGEFGIFFFS